MLRYPLLCAVLAASAAFARAETTSPLAETAPVPVDRRIVLVVDEYKAVRNLPLLVAERLGYFREGGMDVVVVNVRDDVWHGDMLMDGRADAVMAYWHHTVVNQSVGRDTEAIVTLGVTPGMKVLVRDQEAARYRTPRDLAGARIVAGGDGSSKTTVANALVIAGGHALGDYTRMKTDGAAINTTSLRNGTADLLVAPTPDADTYVHAGVARVFADLTTPEGTRAAFGVPFPTATIFMTRERTQQHPEMARHLARAFVRALDWMHAHSAEEVVALVPPEDRGKDAAHYLAAVREALPMFSGDGRMPADGAAFELKVLQAFDARYAKVAAARTYTNAFVDDARKELAARRPVDAPMAADH